MLVSLLRMPSTARIVPRTRSRSGRVSTPISAMRSHVPLVVCSAPDLGNAAQPRDDRRRRLTSQLDGHYRPDQAIVEVLPDAHGEAQDRAGFDESIQPVLRGTAGHIQGRRHLRHRCPSVGTQYGDQALVEGVNNMHTYIMHGCATQSVRNTRDLYNSLPLCLTCGKHDHGDVTLRAYRVFRESHG